jgi:glycosyltransferase involved in cell wall biosynthesis/SAM-dependent methyltransferase
MVTGHTPVRGSLDSSSPTVSVVLIFLNGERFIEDAISSVLEQTFSDWELILVDDGSTDRSTAIARAHAAATPQRIRYVEHDGHVNRGMSPSRRLGIERSYGRLIAFIDADDVWRVQKLEEQVAILDAEPRAQAVYGTPRYWYSWTGLPEDAERDHVPSLGFEANRLWNPPQLLLLTAPLGVSPVPCPSDVLVTREALERVGGFESRFTGAYEDVAFYVKLYLHERVIATDRCWTSYRIHPDQCMSVAVREGSYQSIRLFFLNWFEEYMSRQQLVGTKVWKRLQDVLAPYRSALTLLAMRSDRSRLLTAQPNPVPVDSNVTTIAWETDDGSFGQVWVSQDGGHESLFGEGAAGSQDAAWINPGATYEFRLYRGASRSALLERVTVGRLLNPGVGAESFGSLRRVAPVSRVFGFDRGQPIDRYYIDRFLARHAAQIHGRVLEVGESTYTRRFGGNHVSHIDVLHVVEGNPAATVVGDLADGRHLPASAFDCVLLIQTLHLIFDVPAAVRTLHRILRPGGTVLATFPGISPRSGAEWDDSWYWAFTTTSAQKLFGQVFGNETVTVAAHGNVLAAAAFLYGLASSELQPEELDHLDERYEVLVTVRAVKS